MECPVCNDRRGLCHEDKILKNNCFSLFFRHDCRERTVIPCFARNDFLKYVGIARSVSTQVSVFLETKQGFSFLADVTNNEERTYFTGNNWRQFLYVYHLHHGSNEEMHVKFCATPVGSISVQLPTRPNFHPCMYLP